MRTEYDDVSTVNIRAHGWSHLGEGEGGLLRPWASHLFTRPSVPLLGTMQLCSVTGRFVLISNPVL